jgi:hypothetical protein
MTLARASAVEAQATVDAARRVPPYGNALRL